MKTRIYNSLQFKIMVFSVCIILIPLVTLGYTSYSSSSQIIKNKVSVSNLNTVSQTGNNIDFIFNSIREMSINLLWDENFIRFLQEDMSVYKNKPEDVNYELSKYLSDAVGLNDYIYSITIKGYNGVRYDTRNIIDDMSPDLEEYINKLNGMYYWSVRHTINYDSTKTEVFSLSRIIKEINKLSNALGILSINMKESTITNIYKEIQLEEESSYMIIDDNHIIISSLEKAKVGKPLDKAVFNPIMDQKKSGFYEVTINGENQLITYFNLESTNWKLINIVPLNNLLQDNKIILKTALYSILGCLAISILCTFLFSRKVFNPLKQVRFLMGELEKENYDLYMDVNGNDEIALLGRSFNKMSKRLGEVRSQVYLSKIKQREAELIALQSQINPHFLYNTLDTIYWMNHMEKSFQSANLVQALSQMFRLSLNSGREFTTVQRELEHLKNYLIIQKIRYEGIIDFHMNIDEETVNCKVIKLVLQPLVENAIYHGIEPKASKGKIEISIYREKDSLIYEIIDDGVGVDVDYVEKLLKECQGDNKGFAIKNVNDRLKLFWGSEYGLEFINEETGGTKVIATQKFLLDKECVDID